MLGKAGALGTLPVGARACERAGPCQARMLPQLPQSQEPETQQGRAEAGRGGGLAPGKVWERRGGVAEGLREEAARSEGRGRAEQGRSGNESPEEEA